MQMSQLTQAGNIILDQLRDSITQLTETEFTCPSETLSGSSIGQHLRHTLEFFMCLEQGCNKGVINYDKRSRDRLIETDKGMALLAIDRIRRFITDRTEDKPLLMEVGYAMNSDEYVSLRTNYFRELTYNIEH